MNQQPDGPPPSLTIVIWGKTKQPRLPTPWFLFWKMGAMGYCTKITKPQTCPFHLSRRISYSLRKTRQNKTVIKCVIKEAWGIFEDYTHIFLFPRTSLLKPWNHLQHQRTCLQHNIRGPTLTSAIGPGFLRVEFGFERSPWLELGFGELGQVSHNRVLVHIRVNDFFRSDDLG